MTEFDSTGAAAPTERTTVRRLAKRAAYDRYTVHAIIDASLVCHVGVCVGPTPRVIPMFFGRDGDTLYLHGSRSSRLLESIAGREVCVAFTLIDGLVLARSAFHHSMNYRSVVLFGTGRSVEDAREKQRAFRAITEKVAPGRWDECRRPSEAEAAGTAVVALSLDEASAKIRTGPPKDDEADLSLDWWAGVVPLTLVAGAVEPSADLGAEIAAPPSVRAAIARYSS